MIKEYIGEAQQAFFQHNKVQNPETLELNLGSKGLLKDFFCRI
jgi:hypothetical protein